MQRVISTGGVIINNAGDVLFCHPTNASWKRWAMPKGMREAGEELEAAALREVLEETGWKCKILARIKRTTEYRSRRNGKSVMKTLVLFLMQPIKQTGTPDWEHDAFRWVPFEKIASYASERELPLIEEAIELFKSGAK